MPSRQIIDARHQMRWHQRLFSDAGTAMLWGLWLWLWRPVLSVFAWMGSMGSNLQPALTKLVTSGSPPGLESGVVALVGTSGTLLLWNLLPSRKPKIQTVQTLGDYARHFDLPEQSLLDGRASRICVIHHDAQGRIIGIEPRA